MITTDGHWRKDKENFVNKKNLQKLSLILLIGALFFLALAYFFFHFVTDEGITFSFHAEAGKPFVTLLIGIFGVNCLFGSAVSLLAAYLFYGREAEAKAPTEKAE